MTMAPAFDSPEAQPFNALLAAMRAELAALDGGDAATIEAATTAKLAALIRVRDAGPAPIGRLQEARDLNALASARVNMMMASIERRLSALATARGAPPTLTYARGGRSAHL
jgi:hypothetical protein